ncbi:hypothetical protein [Sphingobium sp. WCS2017Hpa-17]|uniref:hypothetical protein n=1 Tax=Sphingobium sp. WCS2017Hpa-17 TaxID=3073638 RepID=UPI00288B7F77|nr:hypothetical protein [Sphingobium sp. WCS2017Hpa-17]
MRINAINMLNQAAKAISKEGRKFAYDYSLQQLAEHLGDVRDGKHTWEEFAEFYCLTERDRRAK